MSRAITSLALIIGVIAVSSAATAADLPSLACLSPSVPGAYDPAVRDAQFRHTTPETLVEFCVVSEKLGYSWLGTSASLFDKTGHLLGGTQTFQIANVRRRQPDGTGAPSIIVRVVLSTKRLFKDVGPVALVQLSWVECDSPPQDTCKDKPATTDLYIVSIRESRN